jgi:hypothetical protein
MAGKAGQIIPRGERTWLVRVFMGRDSESGTRQLFHFSAPRLGDPGSERKPSLPTLPKLVIAGKVATGEYG